MRCRFPSRRKGLERHVQFALRPMVVLPTVRPCQSDSSFVTMISCCSSAGVGFMPADSVCCNPAHAVAGHNKFEHAAERVDASMQEDSLCSNRDYTSGLAFAADFMSSCQVVVCNVSESYLQARVHFVASPPIACEEQHVPQLHLVLPRLPTVFGWDKGMKMSRTAHSGQS